MTQSSQPPVVQPVRSGIAAGLLGAMVLVSGSLALWAGLQLLRGERTGPAFAALPADCSWVLVADDPEGLATALRQGSNLPQLPAPVRAQAAAQAALWLAATRVPDLDATQPWAICGQPEGAVLAAVRRSGDVERYAWTLQGDARALLDRAAVRKGQPSLDTHLPFRTSLERVGGGQAHLYLDARILRNRADLPSLVRDGLQHAQWLGAALRVDDTEAKVHLHVGTAPAGALWLKAHFDALGALDAAPLVDPQAIAAGVVRVHPGAWLARSEDFMLLNAQLHDSLGLGLAELAPAATGHVVWQVLGTPATWLALVELARPDLLQQLAVKGDHAGIAWQRAGRFLALAPTPALAQRGAQLAGRTQPPAGLEAERARILADSQGFYLNEDAGQPPLLHLRGPARCEALWVDTGFVAELSLPITPTPH